LPSDTLAADGVHVEPDVAEQAVIAAIRQLREGGRSMRRIAADLNSRGLRTRRGSEWRLESIARVVGSWH
jgi:Recombinase